MRIEEAVRRVAQKNPRKTAIVFGDEAIAYEELDARGSAFGMELRAAASGAASDAGGKVLILSRNSIDCIIAFLGCFNAGFAACPINWRLSPKELSCVLRRERFELAVVSKEFVGAFRKACELCEDETNCVVLENAGIRCGSASSAELANGTSFSGAKTLGAPAPTPGVAIQFFTSGTTGAPKGVPHTHDQLVEYADMYSSVSDWRADDTYLTCSNLAHLAGFSCLISLMLGNTLVLFDRFESESFVAAIRNRHVTRVSLVPTLIVRLLEDPRFSADDFANVRKIIYGGAPLPSGQAERIIDSLPCDFEVAYGSTETCCISVLTGADHREAVSEHAHLGRLESVGRPLSCVEAIIVDADDNPVQSGCIGEIAVKSPFMYQGYSTGDAQRAMTSGGFHRTGDMGYFDEDGYLYIVNRRHDMIVSGGENVYPSEVERCISKMSGLVEQVCVTGLPDATWGEIVAAFVVPVAGVSLLSQDIVSFCKSNIASFKKPKRIYFVDSLPLNDNGKVDRKALRQFAIEASSNGTSVDPLALSRWIDGDTRKEV